jgi:hypothetical protein
MTEYRAEDTEGHAIHFLKRLERAEGDAASLALSLYHDPEMIRAVLAGIRIPEGFDRAAVSLDAKDEGPYIVASRTGRFVTCLAHGMSVKDLYVISNARLLAHIAGNAELRERRSKAEAKLGTSVEELFPRLMRNGDNLSKEEFLGISALQPAVKMHLFQWLLETTLQVGEFGLALLRFKRFNLKDKAQFEGLETYWNFFHAAQHLALLSAMTGPKGLERAFDVMKPDCTRLFLQLLISGSPAAAIRVAWFIGKLGSPFLADCKRMAVDPDVPTTWLLGILSLLAMGLRHAKLKTQVTKALENSFKSAKYFPEDVLKFMGSAHKDFKHLFMDIMHVLIAPEKIYELVLQWCRKQFINAYSDIDFPPAYRYENLEEVPSHLAFAFGADISNSFTRMPWMTIHAVTMMPWAASCAAEDFYFPQDFLKCVHKPWTPELSIRMVENEREARGMRKTVIAEKLPGRNDPCPCGSGRKFKKCCLNEY